jgi:cell division septum initiation protein DivIVA
MAEMDGLKKRVELIDVRLKSAHSARERETAALMQTWEQIRDRFKEQREEITRLRDQVAELEDSRDDLLKMVHGLLAAIESGLDNMADETVPKIKDMAGQLLANNTDGIEPAPLPSTPSDSISNPVEEEEEELPAEASFHDELLSEIERTMEGANTDDYVGEMPSPPAPTMTAEKVETVEKPEKDRGKPASPGIRNLVARIEKAVGEDFFENHPAVDAGGKDDDDDDLSRDLREIEALRDELHGLRHRISAGAY